MTEKDVEQAILFVKKCHNGQVDKAGKPYFGHLKRVASRMKTPIEKVVAFLHDSVEDTGVTLAEIEAKFGPEVADAVEHMTHRPDEPYEEYVLRAMENDISRRVKISDLIDNSNLSRLKKVTLEDVERQAKYNRSLQVLLSRENSPSR